VIWHLCEKTLSIRSIVTRRRELFYWGVVIATFALGTAAGDLTAYTLGLGFFPSALLFLALFLLPALGYWKLRTRATLIFWFAYTVTRPLGASFADWMGKSTLGGLGLGDGWVGLALALAIIGFVWYLTTTRRRLQRPVDHPQFLCGLFQSAMLAPSLRSFFSGVGSTHHENGSRSLLAEP
jgi:uncharacterized membrane-anchored protein